MSSKLNLEWVCCVFFFCFFFFVEMNEGKHTVEV